MTRVLIPILVLACGPDHLLPEGQQERDLNRDSGWNGDSGGLDSGTLDTGGLDSGTLDTGDLPVDPEPSERQVCYPGEDWSYTACFDLVDWSADWGPDYEYPEPYQDSTQYTAPLRFVDLQVIDPSASLAPNFVVSEFMALAKGRFSMAQVHMVETLQDLRDESGGPIYINSGYRSPAYNSSVGGVEHSRHMFGDAADMTSGALDLEGLAALCDTLGADYVGTYETHIHCDWRYTPLDSAFFDPERASAMAPPEHGAQLTELEGKWSAPATGFDEGEPLRIWEARDSTELLLQRASGRTFEPPPRTASISVLVGGQVRLERMLN